MDAQLWQDGRTVVPTGTTASEYGFRGVVSLDFASLNAAGFDGSGATTPTGTALNLRGVPIVKVYADGPGYCLVDQSGTGAAAITNGIMLAPSRATAGYLQGASTAVIGQTGALAMLPTNNLAGSAVSLAAGALTQGSNTATVGGAPAAGDVLSVTFQVPYNYTSPGVAQTQTVSTTLTTAQAATTTTAATALAAALNANATFAKYYVASAAAAVVTITAAGPQFSTNGVPTNLFLVTYATGGGFYISPSGQIFNGATLSGTAVGGSTLTVAGNIAGGAGYKGVLPCLVTAP